MVRIYIYLLNIWLCLGGGLGIGHKVWGQEKLPLGPEELVKILNDLKSMKKNPVVWKQHKEQNRQLTQQVKTKINKLDSLKDHFDELADYEEEQLDKLDSLKTTYWYIKGKKRKEAGGIAFKIQIGVYKKHPLDRFQRRKNSFFSIDYLYGKRKYMLGNFSSYGEAQKFNTLLKRMGANTYIVGYKKGRRVKSISSLIDY